eukprot:c3795_g1_i1.p2 GENE.c3795_g1_i1~~c3795_g1_i1.p2  ORF type:complete len:101 (+),score=20.27 c3795_g1_i1:156-458(+)
MIFYDTFPILLGAAAIGNVLLFSYLLSVSQFRLAPFLVPLPFVLWRFHGYCEVRFGATSIGPCLQDLVVLDNQLDADSEDGVQAFFSPTTYTQPEIESDL